ncbi:MAG: hypothetical protein ACLU99_07540 [Alphaproteobacteria bacterium]
MKERALQYGIPLDIARQCEKTDVPCPALADYLAKGYVLYRKELKQALTFIKGIGVSIVWRQREA